MRNSQVLGTFRFHGSSDAERPQEESEQSETEGGKGRLGRARLTVAKMTTEIARLLPVNLLR